MKYNAVIPILFRLCLCLLLSVLCVQTCKGCDGVLNSGKMNDACGNCVLHDSPDFQKDPDSCVKSGVSVGTVIAIVIPLVVFVAAAVYWYMRRQSVSPPYTSPTRFLLS